MKKQYLFVFLFVVLALPVFAEEGGLNVSVRASTTPIKVRADVKADIEAKRASSTERKAEMRENMLERKASTTERREDRKEERDVRREDIKNNIEQRKASSTERRLEMQEGLAKRKVEHVTKVLLATIERLEKIITRIESRIEKIQERGGDTTEAESYAALAKEDLADARIALEAFASLDLSGSTARENFETIRAAAAEAREHIRAAHRNLMLAVRALKGSNTGVGGERRATSTATSTSDSDD